MRRFLFAVAALLLISVSVPAQDKDLISVNPGFDDMTISIAGFDLKLGPSDEEFMSVDFITPVNLGLTTLVGNEGYPDTWFLKNLFFSDDIVTLKMGGNRPGALFLSTGARLECFSFRMADGRAIFIDDTGVPYRNGGTVYKKSLLKLNYIGVPVSLGINLNKRFSLAATGTFEFLFDANNKLKTPKTVTHLDNLNRYRCSVELSLMDNEDVGFFVNYGLTPVFLESSGIDAHTISFGFRLL